MLLQYQNFLPMASGKWVCQASKSARQVSLPGKGVCQASESARQVSLPGKWVCQARESARQVSLPVTWLTWSCDHASGVLGHHVGVNTVERPDPKGLSEVKKRLKKPAFWNLCNLKKSETVDEKPAAASGLCYTDPDPECLFVCRWEAQINQLSL